jgi:hypothetical protein
MARANAITAISDSVIYTKLENVQYSDTVNLQRFTLLENIMAIRNVQYMVPQLPREQAKNYEVNVTR